MGAAADPGRRPGHTGPVRTASGSAAASGLIETTQEWLASFEVIRRRLRPTRLIAREDTLSRFKNDAGSVKNRTNTHFRHAEGIWRGHFCPAVS